MRRGVNPHGGDQEVRSDVQCIRMAGRPGHLHADLLAAARQYASEVADGRYPDQAHSYA
jgi:ketopantoate hydroxymethyltransferase